MMTTLIIGKNTICVRSVKFGEFSSVAIAMGATWNDNNKTYDFPVNPDGEWRCITAKLILDLAHRHGMI
ncbi:hypothetical protein [Janthinobacterium sp. HH102]|uniref:hypothetical protein n=1 Tax=Janthinobacterium sp. HH102 TaxID=1537274 RepID=UPI00111305A9|nr:hypothetical protein [Janthinobacterium sp. HH102]